MLKRVKQVEKCSSPLSNNQGYTSSTYEFMINGKNYISLQYGSVCGSCLYKPIVITKNQPCKVPQYSLNFRYNTRMFKNLLKEYQEGYLYLFSDRSFYKKLWIIPLLLFFPFIKHPFGIIFIKGWQVQMVEDIMLDKPLQSLQIKKIVLKGLQITGVTIIYWMIPTAFCYLLGLKGILGLFLDILEFIQDGLTGYLTDYIEDYIANVIYLTFIWGIISNPILQCGIIRYALTGKWLELLNIPKNILFLMANLHNFLKFHVFI